jgi:formate C-acetyltransferase
MKGTGALRTRPRLKEPTGLSPRIRWLRDYYFKGADRRWNNEFTSWTTGTPWDTQFQEMTYYIVPEVYLLLPTMGASYRQSARPVPLHPDFWRWSLVERRAWFVREVMVNHLPHEVLPGDLIAGGRFNIQTSLCLTQCEAEEYGRRTSGPDGARREVKRFHDHGYGNAGATSGHLLPGYERVLKIGFKGIAEEIESLYRALPPEEAQGPKGAQLRAMLTAAGLPRELAARYAALCRRLVPEGAGGRSEELQRMAAQLERVPWEPAASFWEAVQSLWLTHMLVMADENYPGPGTSFGRIDQYLLPYWRQSCADGMSEDFGKEILKCFWMHCNTAYDAQIRTGNQGITAGFGQLITLSGLGKGGKDLTNELTYVLLDVIDEMSPILEPKPNVRLHRNSPERLLDRVVEMIASSQGAPFLLNFDERSIAGLLRQARLAGIEHLINRSNVHDYAPVGCLENTMVGNDRSGTVDNNLNLVKAVELALTGGRDLLPFKDPITGQVESVRREGPDTADSTTFTTFEQFWSAYEEQTRFIVRRCVAVHEASEAVRSRFFKTPYLSCLVKGCAQSGRDVTEAGAEINFTTLEAVTFATTVDSLLAVKHLVFDRKACTMAQLIQALRDNWRWQSALQAMARMRTPKYGRDDDEADRMAARVMDLWCSECWKHRTEATGRRYRPGMLSWNYWAADGAVVPATPDGRQRGAFLSNAICPSNGADIFGPTANTNSVGKALEGLAAGSVPASERPVNLLPNGASHTITFSPALLRDPEHQAKFKAFLRGYAERGGTALQINVLDSEMLREAQEHPQDFRHLLVRITGYNAYFTTIGRELQDEVIARLSHGRY